MNNETTPQNLSALPVTGLRTKGAIHQHVTGTQRYAGDDELLSGSAVAGRSLSFRQTVHALVTAPHFRAIARSLPDPQRHRPGRKSQHPVPMYFLYEQLLPFMGSQSRLDAELRDPVAWHELCVLFKDLFGLDMPVDKPIQKNHVETWRRLMTLEDLEANTRPALRAQGFDLSRQMGALRIQDDVDWTNLSPDNVISGDGTWLKPWSDAEVEIKDDEIVVSNSRATELSQVRHRDDVMYFRKDGRWVRGRGYVGFHARTDVAGQRITLDLAPIPARTGEWATAESMLNLLIIEAEGAVHGVTYDGAVDATAIVGLMELGVVPIVPVQASSKRDLIIDAPEELWRSSTCHDKKTRQKRKKKNCRVAPIKLVSHQTDNGTMCEHELWAYDGDVTVGEKKGNRLYVRYLCPLLARTRTGGPKNYRFSLTVDVPCPHGSFTTSINLHGVYNRGRKLASALRPVAFSHDDYRRLTGRRNDSESAWATLKLGLRNRRSSRLNHAQEHLTLLAAVTASNAIAYYNFKRSGGAK